jgi:multidrug efflux pump subunit AcrA (membrane-fusion protein)
MGYPLWFSLEEDLPLGQRVTVEVVMKSWEAQILAPVAAVSGRGCLWVVEDGVARPVQVEVLRQDGSFVSVDGSLEGARVILQPDEQKLSPGRPVREGTP